jgi:FKBP-type peptidyl-prolyl cis-trans isomerase FklB
MTIKILCSVALLTTLVLAGCDKPTATVTSESSGGAVTSMPSSSLAPVSPSDSTSTNGWTTTASGLKYQVMKKGSGTASPKASDTVKVHYHGTLLDGTVFDSSVQRGEPISFPLNGVIPGWTEGLQLMKVGDKFKFEIPSNLAYGANSPSPKIPPNSTLVFEVELLGIQ